MADEEAVIIGIGLLALAGFVLYYFYEKELKGKEVKPSYQYTWQTPVTGEEYGRYVERVYPVPQSTIAVSQAYIYSTPIE